MIKSITLNNFQSHRDTHLEFDSGVNVIVGDSANGKTGFLRGMDACLFKTPFYVSWWADEGFSEIEMSDVTVRREYSVSNIKKCPDCKEPIKEDDQICPSCKSFLSNKTNVDRYIFDGDTEHPIQKFGVRLPEPWLLRMKMYPIFFIDFEDNLNRKKQHDDFFFIGNTYGGNTRNKILSSLIPDSSKVDIIVKNLNTKLSANKSKYEFYQETVEKTKRVLEDTEIDFQLYEDLKVECSDLLGQIETCETELTELESIQAKLAKIEPRIKLADKVAKIGPAIDKLLEASLKGITMEHETTDIVFLGTRIEKVGKIANIPTTDFPAVNITEMCSVYNNISDISRIQTSIEKVSRISKIPIQEFNFPDVVPVALSHLAAITRIELLGKTFETVARYETEYTTRMIHIDTNLGIKRSLIVDLNCPLTNKPFCPDCKTALCKGDCR